MGNQRCWVHQVGLVLPPGVNPEDIPELAELQATLDAVVARLNVPHLVTSTFIADSEEERATLTDTLAWHRQLGDGSCACGSAEVPAGSSSDIFARHTARVFEDSVWVRTSASQANPADVASL